LSWKKKRNEERGRESISCKVSVGNSVYRIWLFIGTIFQCRYLRKLRCIRCRCVQWERANEEKLCDDAACSIPETPPAGRASAEREVEGERSGEAGTRMVGEASSPSCWNVVWKGARPRCGQVQLPDLACFSFQMNDLYTQRWHNMLLPAFALTSEWMDRTKRVSGGVKKCGTGFRVSLWGWRFHHWLIYHRTEEASFTP